MAVRRKQIRTLAEQLLEEHRIRKPPVPIEQIAKGCGVQIEKQAFDGEISGFLYRDRNRSVVGVNRGHALTRQRFTTAHELAHYLLHPTGLGEVHIDRDFVVKLRNELSSQGTDDDEKEANYFAAELLMPASFIRRDLLKADTVSIDDDDFIAKLAAEYKVSVQALMIRLANLGFIKL